MERDEIQVAFDLLKADNEDLRFKLRKIIVEKGKKRYSRSIEV
jgi:hypothetical protein